MTYILLYAPFGILQSLIRSLLWKYSNLPGAHVSPYPVKDGLRLLWVFKNSILMTTHPKSSCVSLTVIRSYIKSRRAAITGPAQPSAGAGLELRRSPALRRGPGFRSTDASSLQRHGRYISPSQHAAQAIKSFHWKLILPWNGERSSAPGMPWNPRRYIPWCIFFNILQRGEKVLEMGFLFLLNGGWTVCKDDCGALCWL